MTAAVLLIYPLPVLRTLICPRLKASPGELISSMHGCSLTEAQRSSLELILSHIEYLADMLVGIDEQIEEMLDSREYTMVKLLILIPGVAKRSAKAIIASIGIDLRISQLLKPCAPGRAWRPATTKVQASARAGGP